MRVRGICALAIVAFAAIAAWLGVMAPSAGAAVTIGSDLSRAADASTGCPAPGCTYVQRTLPGRDVTAPFDGVIVRWRVRASAASPHPVTLRVVRGAGAASTGAGTSETRTVPAGDGIHTFDSRVPIRAGDFIGIDCCSGVTQGLFNGTVPGAVDFWGPPLGDGETRVPSGNNASLELLLNADIEPDCDSDSLGDETQDADISSCNPPRADGTLTIDASKGKVEKGRKVTLTGQLDVATNESCEQNRQVQIQRRLKSEDDSKFEAFATVNTDAAGNYSLRVKVKKTRFYRAIVGETEACDDEVSNSQKVRVQKK